MNYKKGDVVAYQRSKNSLQWGGQLATGVIMSLQSFCDDKYSLFECHNQTPEFTLTFKDEFGDELKVDYSVIHFEEIDNILGIITSLNEEQMDELMVGLDKLCE